MNSVLLICDKCGRKSAFTGWTELKERNADEDSKAIARLKAVKVGWKIGIDFVICEKCPEPFSGK